MKETDGRVSRKYLFAGLGLLLVVGIWLALSFGPAGDSFTSSFRLLMEPLFFGDTIHAEMVSESYARIFWYIRFPRVLMALFTGAALAVSGGAFQSVFRNPMADPYVLGISSGASLGAAIAIVMGVAGGIGIPLAAFCGALGTAFLVFQLGLKRAVFNQNVLLLTGIAISMMLTALISLLLVLNSDKVESIVFWMMGGFNAVSWSQLRIVAPVVILGVLALFFYSRELNLLTVGNDTAHSLGVRIKTTITVVLIITSLMVAVVVAYSGAIGFIGLIVPHVMRFLSGPDNKYVIPGSALMGGILLIVADTLARNVIPPAELPVGCITALFGAPFFLVLLMRKQGV
ncbi:iron ABC transporter permease [Marinilabiliaceae bacterium JC017]|nr:iron ABC transporter permease [Marinilabiliaceae bacterium JC017]